MNHTVKEYFSQTPMAGALPMPPFERLDAQRIVVGLDSGGVQLRYSSEAAFRKDVSRMCEALADLPGTNSDSHESVALIWEVIMHRLMLLNRGLIGSHHAFSKKDILEDPGVYRTVLAELDRRHNYDREQSIPLFASFFGLDRTAAEKLAASKDAFDRR